MWHRDLWLCALGADEKTTEIKVFCVQLVPLLWINSKHSQLQNFRVSQAGRNQRAFVTIFSRLCTSECAGCLLVEQPNRKSTARTGINKLRTDSESLKFSLHDKTFPNSRCSLNWLRLRLLKLQFDPQIWSNAQKKPDLQGQAHRVSRAKSKNRLLKSPRFLCCACANVLSWDFNCKVQVYWMDVYFDAFLNEQND